MNFRTNKKNTMANHLTWTPTKKISSSFLPISSAALSESNCTFATTKGANFERLCSGVPLLYFSPAGCSPCLNQPLGKCRIQNTIPHYQIYNSLVFVSQMCFFFRPDGQDSSMGEGDKKVQLERVNNKS